MKVSVVCSLIALTSLTAATAYADSAACRAEILEAYKKSFEIPNHTYLSQIESGSRGLVAKSEMINVGNKSYVKLVDVHAGKTTIGDGSWAIARVSPQESAKVTLQVMRDAAKEAKNYQCAHVRDETIDGVSATVYSEHTETDDGTSDAQAWISKSERVILKYEAKTNDMTVTIRYVYSDIRAPANAKGTDQ